MRKTDYPAMYKKIYKILGDLTPLRADCGQLCGAACCKGDAHTGMRLFPQEESPLTVTTNEGGSRLAVCDGTCDRAQRPLSCRIFPFFPTIDEKGRIFVEMDHRADRLCPLLEHSEEIAFDPRFFRAVKRVGKILAKDAACRAFLGQVTEEIDLYRAFLEKKD
ncbi:MAG: hypothetical protein IJF56_02985 [Clostridia bacterium]|nr:hypothetical protein [Clostridia bacterium]